jgi:omega-6 fatty acid desaturase (delta-12 desaturase)
MSRFEEAFEDAKENWRKIVRKYMKPVNTKSYIQLANSLLPFLLSWPIAFFAYQYSVILCLLVALVSHVFLLRIFIIMHDCGHSSFFRSKKKNDFWGVVCGVFTFSPYHQWSRAHRYHHKHSGNLNYRGIGDVDTLTTEEYSKLSFIGRLKYRAIRSPFVFLFLGPLYVFLFQHRFTKKEDGRKERLSVYLTNLLILSFGALVVYLTSLEFYLVYQLSVLLFSSMVGIFLFYVQHQYEKPYWKTDKEWNHFEASILGSSYLKLPKVFQWASGNIGYHHIHHLCSSIPNYNLEKAYKENPVFQNCTVIGLKESFRCLFLSLYDKKTEKLISFREYRKKYKNLDLGTQNSMEPS